MAKTHAKRRPAAKAPHGRKGGLARAKALSPARRRAIARKAALARWGQPRAA